MKFLTLSLLFLVLIGPMAACQVKPLSKGPHPAAVPPKPDKKAVIYLLMQNWDVALKTDPSCNGVGTAVSDSTIGQFLAGFLEYHSDSTTSDRQLLISIDAGDDPSIREPYWKVTFIIGGRTDGEPWRWGVSFGIRISDRSVMRNTFRCIGAG